MPFWIFYIIIIIIFKQENLKKYEGTNDKYIKLVLPKFVLFQPLKRAVQ